MTKVAVIGGGFAGIYAIRKLQKNSSLKITLFEPREEFVFTPLLHEVAADVLHVPAVTHPYTDIFRNNLTHIRKKVDKIDLKKNEVHIGKKTHPFDYLIVAIGAKTFRLREGLPVHELKSIEDALAIRRAVEKDACSGSAECVIVGGGPTGVELAAELIDFYKYRVEKEHINKQASVTLLQSGPAVLKDSNKRIQQIARKQLKKKGITIVTEARVHNIKNSTVYCTVGNKQKQFKASTIIWTAGVVPNALEAPHATKEKERFIVTRSLQIKGHEHAFAVGDVAHVKDNPVPDLAQAAVQQGSHVGNAILRLESGKKVKNFKFENKGFLISLGQKYGAAEIGGLIFSGFPAWFLWRTIYLLKFIGVRSKMQMASEYTLRLFKRYQS